MNGDSIFIDTNIVIYLLSGNDRLMEILEGKRVHVSFVTELECLGSRQLNKADEKRILDFFTHCEVVEMRQALKQPIIELRRRSKLKLPDCIIAASAAHLEMPLLTADSAFERLEGVEVAIFKPE